MRHGARRVLQVVVLSGVLLVAVMPLSALTAGSEESVTITSELPVDLTVWVACTSPGELVQLDGSLMAVTRQTTSDTGVVTTYAKYNPANVTGVGSITGTTFRGAGVSISSVIQRSSGETTLTSIENFLLLARGPGNNVTIHLNMAVTIAPDGSITARSTNATTTCR